MTDKKIVEAPSGMEQSVSGAGKGNGEEQSEAIVAHDAANVVGNIVGAVEWINSTRGYCKCPGQKSHISRNSKKDCIVYLDKVPTIKCFHSSCQEIVEKANVKLRAAISRGQVGSSSGPRKMTQEEKQRQAKIDKEKQIKLRAANSKNRLLKEWVWTYASICSDSPVSLDSNAANHWKLLLNQFNDSDVVWIGDLYQSGKPEYAAQFKTKEEWLTLTAAPAQFTCPSLFKPGSYARSNENVTRRGFLVVESDELKKDEVGAIFRWLREKVELRLRAIVDTAGKSLHAWFEYPAVEQVEELKLILPELGCDPKLFTASQPVRLPGALRDGKHQRLVYLAGKEVA